MQKVVLERSPHLRDLGSGNSVPVSVSPAWRAGFGYVLAAVSVAVPAGSHYESGKLVPVTAKMVPVTPRALLLRHIRLCIGVGAGKFY